jgi:CO/xanthine dehydrogenase Mo-binding subunit
LRVPPLYEDGPDNGTWNFDRYYMPLASDVVVWQQTAKVLPALSETDPPKGWQRWQMIPIISALVNAIAHVTGQRFRQTSVTAENIRKFVSGAFQRAP